MRDEQKEFRENYHSENYMNDYLYLDIETRARKRYNKLYEDGMKTEHDRMGDLKAKLKKEFKVSKDKIEDVMEEFGGTTEKLYFHIAELVGMNVDTLNKLNQFGR